MVSEMEYWAAAVHAEREHGDRAPAYIAERIGALALEGDTDGVEFWKIVATCWLTLQEVKDENGEYPEPSA